MHFPVLLKEAIELLDPQAGENFIDATIGGGGHALALLEKIKPEGKVLGFDLSQTTIDNLAAKIAGSEKEKRLVLVCNNFTNLKEIVEKEKFGPIKGILADLGFSSMELEESGKGLSFLKDEILDMRFGPSGPTAAEIINQWPKEALGKIFTDYGEEKFSRQIAEKIIEARREKPIVKTGQLVEIVKAATPEWYSHQKIHPATKIFQALRIAVNDELEALKKLLPQALEVLSSGGRLAIISFHSLEDRIVKNYFREQKQQGQIKILTKKPVRPSRDETKINSRSRSAKLRAAQKL